MSCAKSEFGWCACAGKNVWIEGASIGDGTIIHDNARVVFSVLDKKVVIGEDATVMPWCVFGEKVGGLLLSICG